MSQVHIPILDYTSDFSKDTMRCPKLNLTLLKANGMIPKISLMFSSAQVRADRILIRANKVRQNTTRPIHHEKVLTIKRFTYVAGTLARMVKKRHPRLAPRSISVTVASTGL
jgi:hypothetical protein